MALGGITPDNILEIKDYGFGGAVVMGDLWNKFKACHRPRLSGSNPPLQEVEENG